MSDVDALTARVVAETTASKGRRPKKRGKAPQAYVAKSNALNMTVYDAHGKPLAKAFVEELIEEVNRQAVDSGYFFSYTTT